MLSLLFARMVALAAEPARIAVVHVGEDESSRRLKAETAAVGLSVVDVRSAAGDPRSTLAIARAARAVAALRLGHDEVEIVILGKDRDEPVYRDVVRAGTDPLETLPVRAVEQLRARLVKLELLPDDAETRDKPSNDSGASQRGVPSSEAKPAPPPAAETSPPLPPPPEAPKEQPPERVQAPPHRRARGRGVGAELFVGLGFGGEVSAGRVGPSMLGTAGIHYEPTQRFGVSLTGDYVAARSVSAPAGTADVSEFGADVLVRYAVVPMDHTVAFSLGAGGGVVSTRMVGHASTPDFSGVEHTVVVGRGALDAALLVRLAPAFRLRVEMLAAILAPRPAVVIDGRTEATLGRPLATAVVGVDFGVVTNGAQR